MHRTEFAIMVAILTVKLNLDLACMPNSVPPTVLIYKYFLLIFYWKYCQKILKSSALV